MAIFIQNILITSQRFGLLKVEGNNSAHQLPAFAFCTGTPIVV
jgi:hypothetical protein